MSLLAGQPACVQKRCHVRLLLAIVILGLLFTLTARANPAKVALTASANPIVWQQSTILTATVDRGATGTITFHFYSANSTLLGQPVPIVGNQAQMIVPSSLPVGTWPIFAVYSGDSYFDSSVSNEFDLQVVPATSNITIAKPADASTLVLGQDLSIQAAVQLLAPSAAAATGTVDFMDSGAIFASVPIVPSGTPQTGIASALLTSLRVGPHVLTATLRDLKDSSGNVTITGSTSPPVSVSIKLPCSIQLSTYSTSVHWGQAVTLTATLLRGGPNTTGSLTFVDNLNFPSGTSVPLNANQAQLAIGAPRVGTHTITVSYDGDANFAPATASLTLVVNPLSTVTTLVAPTASDHLTAGQTFTFSAKVQTEIPGFPPAGSVQFLDAGVPVASATLSSGAASAAFVLPSGPHSFNAQFLPGPDYQGDINYLGSQSGPPVAVNSGGLPTSLQLLSSPASPTYGQDLTLTIQVSGQGPAGVPSPSGQVQFQEAGVTFGTASVSGGAATLSTATALTAGLHKITAVYSGDTVWLGSSASASVNITRASSITALSASIAAGQPLLTAHVAPLPPAVGSPTGSVQFRDAITNAVLGSATLVDGSASQSVRPDQIMRSFITVYSGDNNFAPSTAPQSPSIGNAASYDSSQIAADSLAAVFGIALPPGDMTAPPPYPTTLNGVSVTISDQTGNSWPVPIYGVFASATQINFLTPADIPAGLAVLTVSSDTSSTSTVINVGQIAPGIFTVDSSGRGIAAGSLVRVSSDGTQTASSIGVYQTADGAWVQQPIDLGVATDQVYLTLYGTGIRNRPDGSVSVSANGVSLPVEYAGAQPTYPGLDQINVQLPHTLAGSGTVNLTVTVQTQTANPVTVAIQ